tara:strand:+ start:140 stop:325 length:186 start_codon:yes stop_codon:yes gene_type:complete
MAKGFKVKTVAPKVKAPEWDIDAIKARMKGKAIVFCLPGEDVHISSLRTSCNYVSTWCRME